MCSAYGPKIVKLKLSPTQREALQHAIDGGGLWRKQGGYWGPLDQKDEPHRWFAGTQTVQALIDRGLLVPKDLMGRGDPNSVTVHLEAASSALVAT
jgi:hypothetical protein